MKNKITIAFGLYLFMIYLFSIYFFYSLMKGSYYPRTSQDFFFLFSTYTLLLILISVMFFGIYLLTKYYQKPINVQCKKRKK